MVSASVLTTTTLGAMFHMIFVASANSRACFFNAKPWASNERMDIRTSGGSSIVKVRVGWRWADSPVVLVARFVELLSLGCRIHGSENALALVGLALVLRDIFGIGIGTAWHWLV